MRRARVALLVALSVSAGCGETEAPFGSGPPPSAAPEPVRPRPAVRASQSAHVPPESVASASNGDAFRTALRGLVSDEVEERVAANETLRATVDVDASLLPEVIERLGQMDFLVAPELLARFGADAIAPLVEAGGSPDPDARWNAQLALARLARSGHESAVLAALQSEPFPQTRPGVGWRITTLVACGPAGIQVAGERLAGGAVPRDGLRGWISVAGADALPLLRGALAGGASLADDTILSGIGGLEGGGAEFVPALARLLDERPETAPRVGVALRGLGAAGVPLVRRLLGDADPAARRETLVATQALGHAAGDLADDMEAHLAASDVAEERELAAGALVTMGQADRLFARIRSGADDERLDVPTLRALRLDDARCRAFVAAEWVGWSESSDAAARAEALRLGARHGDLQRSSDVLIRRLDDRDLEVAGTALALLGRLDGVAAQAAPAVGRLVRRAAQEHASGAEQAQAADVLRASCRVLARWGAPARAAAGDLQALLDRPQDWLPRLDVLRALEDVGGTLGWAAFCERCGDLERAELEVALRLLARTPGELDEAAEDALWTAARVAPRGALDVLVSRDALGPDDRERLLALVRSNRHDALRYVGHVIRSDEDAAAVLDVVVPLLTADRGDLASGVVQGLVALGPRAKGAQGALLARVPGELSASHALGALGFSAVAPFFARIASLEPERRDVHATAFLRGTRAAGACAPAASTRATCRAWLETRYGAFETRTGLPRDIPKERSDLLRWAIYEATVVE